MNKNPTQIFHRERPQAAAMLVEFSVDLSGGHLFDPVNHNQVGDFNEQVYRLSREKTSI